LGHASSQRNRSWIKAGITPTMLLLLLLLLQRCLAYEYDFTM
jgi:hypothetical protein